MLGASLTFILLVLSNSV